MQQGVDDHADNCKAIDLQEQKGSTCSYTHEWGLARSGRGGIDSGDKKRDNAKLNDSTSDHLTFEI
jgi:hypothetical protein